MSEFKWKDCFEDSNLRDQLVFLTKYNQNPDKFIYQLGDDTFDLDAINREDLQKEFPGAEIVIYASRSQKTTSCVEDEELEKEDDEVFVAGEWQGSIIRIYADHIIYYIDSSTILLWYKGLDPEECVKKILKIFKKKDNKPKEAEVSLVAYNQEYYTVNSKIQPTRINLAENYNDDLIPALEDIKKFLNERKSGLIILRGKVGTGKTSLIRHLITTCPKNYVLVTNTLASHLASPEFISFMLENKNSVFILEDCEQILMDRGDNISGAIANILNMSDGLMSDIFNVKFICTFNADMEKIDKAVLRKGRCFANYEFKELDVEKTKILLNKQGIKLDKYEPMTLAEIFNYQDADCSGEQTVKIGF